MVHKRKVVTWKKYHHWGKIVLVSFLNSLVYHPCNQKIKFTLENGNLNKYITSNRFRLSQKQQNPENEGFRFINLEFFIFT